MSITKIRHQPAARDDADKRRPSRYGAFDIHAFVGGIALLTIAVVLVMHGPQLFPRPLTAPVFLTGPWLAIGAGLAVQVVTVLHLVRRRRWRRFVAMSTSVATLADARTLADLLLVRSSLEDSVGHQLAIRPLAALIYAASCCESAEAPAKAGDLTSALCDPRHDTAWSEMVEAILRTDLHLCREVYPVARMDGYQRASVGVVMHEAVLLWGELTR